MPIKSVLPPLIILNLVIAICTPRQSAATVDEAKIDALLKRMTIQEKVGQLVLKGKSNLRFKETLPDAILERVRNGEIGAFLNVNDPQQVRQLQEAALQSKQGIPLLFARDVIHGYKTIFPIPLGQAASWNPDLVAAGSQVAALEASSVGIRWTFAPMLDICQDSRWGRIAESPGEDPVLAQAMAAAYVKGFQGTKLSDPTHIAACAKHFIGYGAAIGGRDYNTAIISNEQLYNLYLPPFKTAIETGVATVMSSFNEINGEPVTSSRKLLTDILRKHCGFDGFVVSDWAAITEMVDHGVAQNRKQAATLAARAGVDMDMASPAYETFLEALIQERLVPESQLDFYVRNVLRIKFRLGLFDEPFVPSNHPGNFYAQNSLHLAEEAAIEGSVLLKNNGILPLSPSTHILLTGPLAHQKGEQLGTWVFDGEAARTITPKEALEKATFVEGLTYSRDRNQSHFEEVLTAARDADVIVFVGGEEAILSGEAHSRANIQLPGAQEALLAELATLNKPLILVLMAGRPLNITPSIDKLDAVLMMWHPGTMGGPALQKMLFGVKEPSGRLPVSWPKAAGQLPWFYNHKNTGRPAGPKHYTPLEEIAVGAAQTSLGNRSHYLDLGYTPLFPFGYGLSYSEVTYGKIVLSNTALQQANPIQCSVDVTNHGDRTTSEVVQLYAHDRVGRLTRPIRELKRFKKIRLEPGETQTIQFTLSLADFLYYDNDGHQAVESGKIDLYIGSHSATSNTTSINIQIAP